MAKLVEADKFVRLTSQEGETFEIEIRFAKMSALVESMLDEEIEDEVQEIPLPNVGTETLRKVIDFCRHYAQEKMYEIPKPLPSNTLTSHIQGWYSDFITLEQEPLLNFLLATNYMDIRPALELGCAYLATMIKGKSVEELRTLFNIENDFTPEEEAEIKEQLSWCEPNN